MGLIVGVYKNPLGDFTNGGVTGDHTSLTVVNVEGPFEPTEDRPAAMLIRGPGDSPMRPNPIVVPAIKVADVWVPEPENGRCGPMMGGNFVATSDSRWGEAVRRLGGANGATPVHDRFETWEQYRALSI